MLPYAYVGATSLPGCCLESYQLLGNIILISTQWCIALSLSFNHPWRRPRRRQRYCNSSHHRDPTSTGAISICEHCCFSCPIHAQYAYASDSQDSCCWAGKQSPRIRIRKYVIVIAAFTPGFIISRRHIPFRFRLLLPGVVIGFE